MDGADMPWGIRGGRPVALGFRIRLVEEFSWISDITLLWLVFLIALDMPTIDPKKSWISEMVNLQVSLVGR